MARLMIKRVRQSFMTYWTPEPFPESLDPSKYYSGTFIIPPDHPQIKEINKDLITLCNEKWGTEPLVGKDKKPLLIKGKPVTKGQAMLKSVQDKGKVYFRDGDTKPELDGFPGNFFISARSKVRPNYFGANKEPLTEEDGILYSGCYVNVSIETFAYTRGNNGLGARLRGVQYCGKGDAFGGGGPPAGDDEFDEIAMDDDDSAETEEAEEEFDPLG